MKKTLTVCFSLFIFLLGAQAQPKKVVADKIIAIVGDKIILLSEIKNSIADIARQGGTIPENGECLLMEQAIISKVLMLQAQKDSLPVTDEEVEADLDNRIRVYIRQFGTKEDLEAIAGKTIYQIKDDARESVKEQKLAAAMQRKIVDNVRMTPNEVKMFFDNIPKDSLPFFESELEVGQIVLYPKASRDIEEYIIGEMNNYKSQVESGKISFEQLAKNISEDPGSKDRGGLYQINRNEKSWDPVFMSTAFRLKEGEVSSPVKSRFGYHLIQMVEKNGDEITVRHILRIPPITKNEIDHAIVKLDTIRSKIISETIGFNEAASKYSDDETAKYAGPFILNRDGAPYVTIDLLDKEMVGIISKMKVGEISQPAEFEDEQGKKGVRIIYLKSRSEPHRMNLHDDYNKIAQVALEEKKSKVLDKWLKNKLASYYIMVDPDTAEECPLIQKYSTETKGF
ncbi:MAG TPA: peptidylprolyl isomerase [Chitinophagaceae bacterium]|nr:peptidylprolyl isomerase [Chitinophagaceae bacterium]